MVEYIVAIDVTRVHFPADACPLSKARCSSGKPPAKCPAQFLCLGLSTWDRSGRHTLQHSPPVPPEDLELGYFSAPLLYDKGPAGGRPQGPSGDERWVQWLCAIGFQPLLSDAGAEADKAAINSISGLVVEYIVAIDVTRARFRADAYCALGTVERQLSVQIMWLAMSAELALLRNHGCNIDSESPRQQ